MENASGFLAAIAEEGRKVLVIFLLRCLNNLTIIENGKNLFPNPKGSQGFLPGSSASV